jgi:TetR/AcrR family transcriptional regulator
MTPAATPSPREQRRRQHHDLSRQQILDAAEHVFARKGFHDASMKEIGALAEFSVGAVYGFFENKEDLFTQIYLRRGAQFMEGMRAVLAGAGTAREQLHHLADFQVQFFRSHANFGRLFLRASGASFGELESAVNLTIAENYTEAMNLQAKLFRKGQDVGELREGDPEVLAMLFSGMVSAYQSSDPAVVDDAPTGTERMPLIELHEIIDAAFVA